MFNQTTLGWMHCSSPPDTAGFLDTAGLQTSKQRPQPPLSQAPVLCGASACDDRQGHLWCGQFVQQEQLY